MTGGGADVWGWDWSIDGWIVLVGVLSACSCALLGNYLVLRRMSLMGDAISHAVLPGLAIAFILAHSRSSWAMFAGAVIAGVLTAVLTQAINRYGRVEHGAAMGVVFSVLFAIGLVLIRRTADCVDLDPGCVLYGNIVVTPLDALDGGIPPVVVNLSAVLVANMLFVAMFYKELKIAAFDPNLSTALGIHALLMHYALMVMVAVTTVANFEAVGSILVIAMLIVPAAAARLLTDRLSMMILFSLVIGFLSAVLGHWIAAFGPGQFGMDIAVNTSAMMAVVAGGFLVVAIVLAPQYGLVARAYHRLALAGQIARQDVLGLLFRWQEMQSPDAPAMLRHDVVCAVGPGLLTNWAVRTLRRRRALTEERDAKGEPTLRLTQGGLTQAARLVGSHRLWETYLARYFQLAADHLHEPAERMEHYITDAMQAELRDELVDPAIDPQGKPIPGGKVRNEDATQPRTGQGP